MDQAFLANRKEVEILIKMFIDQMTEEVDKKDFKELKNKVHKNIYIYIKNSLVASSNTNFK